MKNRITKTIAALLVFILVIESVVISKAQVQNFTCFQKNYFEGAGWQKANFGVTIDMDDFKISIHDPKLETYIRFGQNSYSNDNGHTTMLQGTDQSGLKCNVFIELSDPPMLTVQYLNKFHQAYKLK